jgi:hypothetical protein
LRSARLLRAVGAVEADCAVWAITLLQTKRSKMREIEKKISEYRIEYLRIRKSATAP